MVNVVIIRQGKNAKGHVLAVVLGSVGKGVLEEIVREQRPRDRGAQRPGAAAMTALALQVDPPRGRVERGRHPRDGHAALPPVPRPAGARPAFVPWETSDGVESWEERTSTGTGRQARARDRDQARGPRRATREPSTTSCTGGSGSVPAPPTGLLAGSRRPGIWWGPPFGAAVWASGYVVLPLLGVYQPIWTYDRTTLEKDLSAHLVFGTATAATYWLADDHRGRPMTAPPSTPTSGGRHGNHRNRPTTRTRRRSGRRPT